MIDDPNPNPDQSGTDTGADDQSQANDKPADTGADTGADEGDKSGEDNSTTLGGKAEGETDKGHADKPAAPEKYELTAPEGMTFDAETFGKVEPVLRELGMSNEGAQKLADAYAKEVIPIFQKRADDAIAQRAADQRKEWDDAFNADPDIGGAKREETLQLAAKAFDFYGIKPDTGIRQLLNESGLGNHPDMIRFVARIGKDIGEDGFDRGGLKAEPLTVTEKFYGKGYGKPQAEQRS